MAKSAGKHGNLNATASRVYEALRREGMGKTKAAKIANASYAGTINYKGGKRKGGKRK